MNNLDSNTIISDVLAAFAGERATSDVDKTREAIRNLIDGRGKLATEKDIAILEALCRKLDIAKRLCRAYDSDWKKLIDTSPVSQATLLASALCLARFGAIDKDSAPGQLCKWLNSAFNAVDIAKTSSPGNLDLAIRTQAFLETHLKKLLVK